MKILISDAFDPSLPGKLEVFGEVTDDKDRLDEMDVVLVRSKTKCTRDYIDKAGGLTDSSHFILLTKPSGETNKAGKKRVKCFRNYRVPDGSKIFVTRKPVPVKPKRPAPSLTEVVKDILAITISCATLVGAIIAIQQN